MFTGFPEHWTTLKKLMFAVGSGIAGAASGIWKTVTGTLIHITDALASPMQKCEVSLEPMQDLHGQDAPYPAGGSAQIWNEEWEAGAYNSSEQKVDGQNQIRCKSPITVIPETSYYCKFNGAVHYLNEDKSLISGANVNNNAITTPSNCYFITFFTAIGYGTTYNHDIAINYPSSITSYSPYSNICPITGWTGCKATRARKNLLDDSGTITHNSYNIGGFPNTLKPNTVYTYSVSGNADDLAGFGYGLFMAKSSAPLDAKVRLITYMGSGDFGTFTTPSDMSEYDNLCLAGSGATAGDILFEKIKPQIELGLTATEYEPYSGTTLSVTFPDSAGTVYGGTVDLVSGKLIVETVSINITNPSLYGEYDEATGKGTFWYISSAIRIKGLNSGLKCNRMKAVVNVSTNSADGDITFYANNVIRWTEQRAMSQADYRAWLANNPLQVVFDILEPIEIQLTPQPISTLKGVNNVWSNSNGDTTIIYKAQSE